MAAAGETPGVETAGAASAGAMWRGLWGVGLLLMSAAATGTIWLSTGGSDGWARLPLVVSRVAVDGGVVGLWAMSAAGLGMGVLRMLVGSCGLAASGRAEASAEPTAETTEAGHGVLALGIGWGLLSLATLLLGMAGWVGGGVAWGLLGVGGVVGVWAVRDRPARWSAPLRGTAVGWLAGGLLAGTAVFLALFPAGVLWPTEPNAYDVLSYHLQLPREWYEAGRIDVLPHNVFSYMPLAMEMHYLLAMGLLGDPWGAMYAAQLMHVAMWIAAGVAAYGLGVRVAWLGGLRSALAASRGVATVGVSRGALAAAGWGAASVVVACPLSLLLAPVAYNEGAVVLYGVLALRSLLELTGRMADADGLKWAALLGVCGGLAGSAKLTAVPLWLVVPAALVAARTRPTRRGLQLAAVVLVTGALVAAPWWLRTAVHANGNPVFPVAARSLGAPSGWDAKRIERFERAHRPRDDQRSLAGRLEAAWRQVAAAPEFGWVLLPGAMVLGVWAVAGGGGWVWVCWALLGVHAAVWLGMTHLQGRFWVPSLPVLAAMWAAGVSRERWSRGVGIGLSATLVAVSMGLVWKRLHPFRTPEGRLVTEVVGVEFPVVERLLVPEAVLEVPPTSRLTLVGDARAYAYRRPMTGLRYTSVFDVTGETAWAGWRVEAGDWVLIHPGELARLSRTYTGLPPVPPPWLGLPGPTLLGPGDPRLGR